MTKAPTMAPRNPAPFMALSSFRAWPMGHSLNCAAKAWETNRSPWCYLLLEKRENENALST